MFQFIGWSWDPASSEQSRMVRKLRQSVPWQAALDCEGLQLFCVPSGPNDVLPLAGSAGVVLGTVFKNPAARVTAFDPAETKRIVESTGRELIAGYWGQYVAFIVDRHTGRKWVLRDPIGGVPCFWTAFKGVKIVFSSVEDVLRLNAPRFSINWDALRTRVIFGPTRMTSSALNEVHAFEPGECVEISRADLPKRLLWDPRDIACSKPVDVPAEAAQLLRTAVRSSVQAWGSCYDSVLVRLSGGLDSSIVLGCLADSPHAPRITAHVYYLASRAGDERVFAQQVVQQAGCPMAVHEKVASDLRLQDILAAPLSVLPAPDLNHLEVRRIDRELITETGARAVFSGEGGDSLFASQIFDNAVADLGIRPGLFTLALRIAPLAQVSVWHMVARAIRKRYSRQHPTVAHPRPLAMEASAIEQAHPWFQPRSDIPPGKAAHIRSVMYSEVPFRDALASPEDPDDIQPLRAQPAVEAALRIPTYVHVHDGRNRGLARHAFTHEVPAEVLNRLWKGRPQTFASRQLWRDVEFVRELLLDGLLVKHQLLNAAKVEQALSGPSRMGESVLEIFDHIISEAWARRWAS